jgi:hypothetical protein
MPPRPERQRFRAALPRCLIIGHGTPSRASDARHRCRCCGRTVYSGWDLARWRVKYVVEIECETCGLGLPAPAAPPNQDPPNAPAP